MAERIANATGSPEQMRVEEERLVREGYHRVPAITPDGELKAMQYKWEEPAPITSLFKTKVVLTWRKP